MRAGGTLQGTTHEVTTGPEEIEKIKERLLRKTANKSGTKQGEEGFSP